MRIDGRRPDQLRPVKITPEFLPTAEGSALVEFGHTKVICTASWEEGVPSFLRGSGQGWITAEYGMLPRSTSTRTAREASRGRPGGRTLEIQRLIGRSLRTAADLAKLGENTVYIDCDVIQADGGTRTAAITGGWVALASALRKLVHFETLPADPLCHAVAAVSVGVVGGEALLDLCYEEDSQAEVDMNVVMTDSGEYVEVQASAEGKVFGQRQLDALLALARQGIGELIAAQKQVLER